MFYLIIAVIIFSILSFFIWIHTARLYSGNADVMVILGYRCDNGEIPPLLRERLMTALLLFKRFSFNKIIVTGGAVGSSHQTEAELMADFLVRHGVDRNVIVQDTDAVDTIENLENCKGILEKENLDTCLIVSNSFHIRRVTLIGKAVGLKPYYYANRRWIQILKQAGRTVGEIKTFMITLQLLRKREQDICLKKGGHQ